MIWNHAVNACETDDLYCNAFDDLLIAETRENLPGYVSWRAGAHLGDDDEGGEDESEGGSDDEGEQDLMWKSVSVYFLHRRLALGVLGVVRCAILLLLRLRHLKARSQAVRCS